MPPTQSTAPHPHVAIQHMAGELSYSRLLCATRLPGAFFLFSMFSTDKNIESLASLIEKFKEYLQLRKSLLQLSLTEKIIRLLTACALTILLAFFFFLVVIFLSFAAVYALSLFVPLWASFLIVAGVQLLMFVIIYCKRHSWIQQPLVRVLVNILAS